MQRLSGTTVERSPHREDDPYFSWYLPEARSVYAFAGGATLGNAGIAGQQYRGQGSGKDRTLEVRKSWFMFENEIICLGSGISSPTDNPVETIILNDRLTDGIPPSAWSHPRMSSFSPKVRRPSFRPTACL